MSFNDDMIKRDDLPLDAHRLIHDLCYHHSGRDVQTYVSRAQEILSSPVELHEHFYEDNGKCKCGLKL